MICFDYKVFPWGNACKSLWVWGVTKPISCYHIMELSKVVRLHQPSLPSCSLICYWMPSRTRIRACTYIFEQMVACSTLNVYSPLRRSYACLSWSSLCRWLHTGHLAKMENHNIPKALPFGQLEKGKRLVGRPRLRYKDTLKYNLKDYGIYISWCLWNDCSRAHKVACCLQWKLNTFEDKITTNLKDRRVKQKAESGLT